MLASPEMGETLEAILVWLLGGRRVESMAAQKMGHSMVHHPDDPAPEVFRATGSPIRLACSCERSRGWSGDFAPEDWKKKVVEIAVEAVEQEAVVTDAGFGNQEEFEGFQGRFRAPVGVQPRPSLHRDRYRLERTAETSIHLSSFRFHDRYRVSLVRQGMWAIPQESSHGEQS